MRPRRALLFMPGDDRRKIEKGISISPDSIIMDLEDGVAFSRKAEARMVIAEALAELDFGRSERLVRINAVSTPFAQADLAAVLPARPDGIVIPKAESSEQVASVAAQVKAAGLDIPLIAIIESARGVVHLREIAAASGLAALCFGAEDLAGDTGAIRQPDLSESAYARGAVVIHARAFGLQAIDTPFVAFTDEDGLTAEARSARILGYTGKLAIHPRQIAILHGAFTPEPDEIGRAQALIAAFEMQADAGTGAFQVDGRMVDMPMIRAAQAVLERARSAGLL